MNESDDSKRIKVIVRLLRPRKGEKPWTIRFTDGTSEEYESQSEVWDRMKELGEEFAGRDRVGRDWDFISTRRKTSESTKNVNESSDEDWHEVTDAFEEFEQRLWSFTKQDMKGRRDAFSRCTNSMEKALREYYNEVVL